MLNDSDMLTAWFSFMVTQSA